MIKDAMLAAIAMSPLFLMWACHDEQKVTVPWEPDSYFAEVVEACKGNGGLRHIDVSDMKKTKAVCKNGKEIIKERSE